MAFGDQKDRAQTVGNGCNVAAALAVRYEDPLEWFQSHVMEIVDTIIAVQAANAIDEAMPGTTTMPAAVPTSNVLVQMASAEQAQGFPPTDPFAHVAPTNTFRPVPQAAPVAIPGAADGDPVIAAQWVEFFQDPSAWWDNSKDKKNPKGPDFKHKVRKDAQGKFPIGLWKVGKGNPSWVPAALQQAGL